MGSSKSFLKEAMPQLKTQSIDQIVRHALVEDIGKGDITTELTVPKDKLISACIVVKEDCVVCGLDVAARAFELADRSIEFKGLVKDGRVVKKGKKIATLQGNAGNILTAERVALNLLTMLSGVATITREFVQRVKPYKVKITDTRKTIPGLRELQKYAVRVGGGYNHRMGLDEMVLIKDNHIKVAEGFDRLPSVPKGFKIEIEVQNLDEFKHALRFKPDVIMLDNMNAGDIKKAVEIRNKTEFKGHHLPTKLEVSGGVDLDSIESLAACGVDIISIGALTHSYKAIDISLEVIA